jgi:hypothetical protein
MSMEPRERSRKTPWPASSGLRCGRLARAVAVVASLGYSVACGSATVADPVQSISLVGPSGEKAINMEIGGAVTLRLSALDASGATVNLDGAFHLNSRNPSVATIDSARVLRSLAGGYTYVVATLDRNGRILADSVEVIVVVPTGDGR